MLSAIFRRSTSLKPPSFNLTKPQDSGDFVYPDALPVAYTEHLGAVERQVHLRRPLREVPHLESTDDAEKTIGAADSEWAQTGVTAMASMHGSMTGPPADSEYAVDPVGVETMSPSHL